MASTKTEKVERTSPTRPGAARAERREAASLPGTRPRRKTGEARRGELRDLLGDYAEQTGSFFG